MASNNIIYNSKFKPFSYSEMLAPVQAATTEHRLIEEGLGELATKASIFDKLASQQTSPVAAAQYKAYADDLTKQVDLMARQGLTPESRKGLLNMKKRFASEITPIELAINKKEELTKEQREALKRDSSLMFDVDYGTISIDKLLNNPNATYKTISGSDLTKKTSDMASTFAKTIQSNPQYKSILGGQYFQQMQQMGYTPQQIMQTVMNDPNAPKELKQIADTVWKESGLDNWDNATKARAREYINAGLYDAIGTQSLNIQANRGYVSPIENERAAMVREEFEWQKEKWKEDRLGVELPDGSRIKDIGSGRVRVTYPDGKFEIKYVSNTEKTLEPSSGMKAPQDTRAIIADKAGFSWVADREGEDNTGWYNWFNSSRETRDWGADARVPDKDKLEPVALQDIPREVLSKIIDKMETNVDPKLYNFYKVKVGKRGYVAIPKFIDSTTQPTSTEQSTIDSTQVPDSTANIKNNLIAN